MERKPISLIWHYSAFYTGINYKNVDNMKRREMITIIKLFNEVLKTEIETTIHQKILSNKFT